MKPINLLALAIAFAICALAGRHNVRQPLRQATPKGHPIGALLPRGVR